MKCYLIYDAYLGSFYSKDAEIDGIRKGGWVGRDQQNQGLIDDKTVAQKLFKMLGKLSRSTLQLMEMDIPDEEYGKIIDEINESRLKMSKIATTAHSGEEIKKAIKGEI